MSEKDISESGPSADQVHTVGNCPRESISEAHSTSVPWDSLSRPLSFLGEMEAMSKRMSLVCRHELPGAARFLSTSWHSCRPFGDSL